MSAEAILLAQCEVAVEPGGVRPALDSLPVVEIVLPVSNVPLLTVVGLEGTESIGLVILPVAFVCVSVRAPKLSFAIGLVVEPFTLVFCVIWPQLNTICHLAALLVNIPCEEGSLHHLDILDVLEVKLLDHLL